MTNRKLTVIDTTLRDGEQSAGVSFSYNEKIEIASHLDQLGVDIIEAGIPVMGIEEQRAVAGILEADLEAEIMTWNRMSEKDLKASAQTGVKSVHFSVPASDLHIYKKLNMTRKELLEKYRKVLDYANKKNLKVSVGAEDASRADMTFLAELYTIAIQSGAKRIRYADTLSVLNPFTAYENLTALIENICNSLECSSEMLFDCIEIDFHGHNDFGLGTANALAAFKAGASAISCSVNGLGERAGNTALEEIVLALFMLEGVTTTISLKDIMKVSKLVELYSGRALHKSKPIVGDMVFSHEAGIHIDGLEKDRRIYTYLDPRTLGREHRYVIGKHSGRRYKKTL